MSSNKIIRKGEGTKDLTKATQAAKGERVVKVGIIGAGKHADSDLTTAQIGLIHEFGNERAPERSFIRSTLFEKRKEIVKLQKKLYKKVSKGNMTVDSALGLIGAFVAGEIQKKIVALKSPPNAASTIAAKGSSNPLVDTVQLKNSITWDIE